MSPNVGSNLRKPHVLPVYIYERKQKFIHDERRRNNSAVCDDRLSSIFPLHDIGYMTAVPTDRPTDRSHRRTTFTVRGSRNVAQMHALQVMTIWTRTSKHQFRITPRPKHTEFIGDELQVQPKARCSAGLRPLRRRIYAASHTSDVSRGGGGGRYFSQQPPPGGRGQIYIIIYTPRF
jgi:hypothetical protein